LRRVEYREPTSIPLPVLEEVINSIDDVASCLPGIAGSRRNSGSIVLLVERKGILGRRRVVLKLRVEQGGDPGKPLQRFDVLSVGSSPSTATAPFPGIWKGGRRHSRIRGNW